MEVSCGLSLNGSKFYINNNTADEYVLIINFLYNSLPADLKMAMGQSVFEHLTNYDPELNKMEW